MSIATDWAMLAGAGLVARRHDRSSAVADDFVELGRNLAAKCTVTFNDLVSAQTTDPVLLAAAWRGRREALLETVVTS